MINAQNSVQVQSQSNVSELLEYCEGKLTTSECIPFLQKFSNLIVVTQNADMITRILAKSQTVEPIVASVEESVSSPCVNDYKRTEAIFSVEDVLMKLLDEGVDPKPNYDTTMKKNSINKVSKKLGFSVHDCTRWQVTDEGRKIGCDNKNAQSVMFSQQAYEKIKDYFLNPAK